MVENRGRADVGDRVPLLDELLDRERVVARIRGAQMDFKGASDPGRLAVALVDQGPSGELDDAVLVVLLWRQLAHIALADPETARP